MNAVESAGSGLRRTRVRELMVAMGRGEGRAALAIFLSSDLGVERGGGRIESESEASSSQCAGIAAACGEPMSWQDGDSVPHGFLRSMIIALLSQPAPTCFLDD